MSYSLALSLPHSLSHFLTLSLTYSLAHSLSLTHTQGFGVHADIFTTGNVHHHRLLDGAYLFNL